MRGTDLLDKMELIDPAFVEEADQILKPKKPVWVRLSALAACLILIVGIGLVLHGIPGVSPDPGGSKQDSVLLPTASSPADDETASDFVPSSTASNDSSAALDSQNLPSLTVSDSTLGMGFESYIAHDVSELVNANPWNEILELSTLPVYKNPLTYDDSYQITGGYDFAAMNALLLDSAASLGLDPDNLTVSDNAPDEDTRNQIREKLEDAGDSVSETQFDPTAAILESDGITITVDQAMTVTVSFEPTRELPKEYHFTHTSSYEELTAVSDWLKASYSDFIGFTQPESNLSGGDYDIYGNQHYSVGFFDKSGTLTEQIIHYNFNQVQFYCDDNGNLSMARIFKPDLSRKIGDYPIISPAAAQELLTEDHYLTSVPYEFPGEAYVQKVELVYRTGTSETYYMPYYRFYVELPEETQNNGLNTYGAYYVPAVESRYISNMPTWEGSFN